MHAYLIDHDDSFTQNIRAWLSPYFTVELIHHEQLKDEAFISEILQSFDRKDIQFRNKFFVLSPGPKSPQDYPHSLSFLKKLKNQNATIPILGICLGMQLMTIVEGSEVLTYAPPLHGKTSALEVLDFNVEDSKKLHCLQVARYHSLYCQVGDNFKIIASSDKKPMIIAHRTYPWLGLQFHPESFLTEKSDIHLAFLKNWLNTCRP